MRTATEPPPKDAHGAYMSLVHTLGLRTGELHRALATRTSNPAFDPEPTEESDFDAWAKRVREEAEATLALLERHRPQLPSPARDEAQLLIEQRDELFTRIGDLAASRDQMLKIRHHGDYHLGQVLIEKNDFIIIDFEGEPGRPLAERRAKGSPLRDVEGMLRSFGYARFTALRHVSQTQRPTDLQVRVMRQWEIDVRREFISAYESATRGTGLYADFGAARGLLALFELEKALYEIRYELGNRPGWVSIPLQGALALAGIGS